MKLVNASSSIMRGFDQDWSVFLEFCARNCYKSEGKITTDSDIKLIRKMIKRDHWTPFEMIDVTVRFITDRGILQELARHRLNSLLVESTRYCDYGNGDGDGHVQFVIPFFVSSIKPGIYDPANTEIPVKVPEAEVEWMNALFAAEEYYKQLRQWDVSPQGARSVLPNSLKTEIIFKASLRQWHHIFKLRCNKAAHPDMVKLMKPTLKLFAEQFYPIYEDLLREYF